MSGFVKRICHITTAHPRYDNRIFYKECKSLSSEYNVNLIVADGKGDEINDNINIFDVSKRTSSRLKRFFITTYRAYRKGVELDCDLYHFQDPEFMFFGWLLRLKGKKVIYDVHEDLPDQVLSKSYIHPALRGIVSGIVAGIEKTLSKKMSAIITVTETINKRFSRFNSECLIINNYPRIEEFEFPEVETEKKDGICYVGGITRIRGIEKLIDLMENLDLSLNLAGNFESESFKIELMNKPGWKKVNYSGFITPKETYRVISGSIAGIAIFQPEPNHITSRPTKIFEYMYAGIPVIASDFPRWKELIEKHDCGICVNPEDTSSITQAILYLKNNPEIAKKMGMNGRRAVADYYSWKTEEEKLLGIYFKILKN